METLKMVSKINCQSTLVIITDSLEQTPQGAFHTVEKIRMHDHTVTTSERSLHL